MADHGAEHLDEATWDRLAANEVEPLERDRYFDHVTACTDCSRIWRSILTLKSEAETRGLIVPEADPRPWWRAQMIPLAVAATVFLAAVAGFFVTLQTDADPSVVRGGNTLATIEGLMTAYDADGVPSFAWTPVAGVTHYRLEIFTEDGRPVWSGDVSGPPAPWPAGTPHTVGRYRWRVDGLDAGGPTARSRLTPMDITR